MTGYLLFYGMLQAGATEIPVTSSGHASNPVWSKDGNKLAFEVNEYAGKIDLFAVNMDGIEYQDIKKVQASVGGATFGSGGSVNAAPVWQKLGPKWGLIFEHGRKGVPNRIYSTDFIRPARPVIQMNQLEGDLSWPALSGDEKSMYFVSDIKGAGDIYSFTFKGQTVKPVVQSEGYSEMAPKLSESGSLLYTRKHGNGEDIYVTTGGSDSKWVGGNGDQTRPSWANDQVVFFSNERGVDLWDIASSSKPSSKNILAKNIRLPMRSSPALSPDRKWVAYGVEDPKKSSSIWFSKLDGSKTFSYDTKHIACGEPSLTESNGQILLAYTALPAEGSAWRKLHVVDVTNLFQ
jgi:Tol biopolymer transport system component